MACKYCNVEKTPHTKMSFETVRKLVDIALVDEPELLGIVFFGGEPLLEKELIYKTVEYCESKNINGKNHFKLTTNGLLLDEEFISYSLQKNVFIALSHDGLENSHDAHRVNCNGKGTFANLEEKIDTILSKRPYTPVMMVVNPDTVVNYYESVKYLYKRGFKYIICSLNYTADWSEKTLKLLEKEYRKLADLYIELTMAEEKFFLSPFEVKISSHINRATYCQERCELGKTQISVAPDGLFYPCTQFVGNPDYCIGSVNTGIDEKKRYELYKANEAEKSDCLECSIKERCNHHCGCLNLQTTGRLDKVSPILCMHERIILPIADKVAAKLYKKRSPLFIQKHYNDMYPIISVIEDRNK